MALLRYLFSRWTWRMAWRDSRTQRARLLLFSSSIILGVAALAAIGSLGKNLERAVEEQAKTLLGADLSVSSREPFSTNEEQLLTSFGGEQAREISFSSMVYFPNGGGTRLAQVRAVTSEFPFYGQLETDPAEAAEEFRAGRGALVEANLLIQFGAHVGDQIKVGQLTVPVVGALKRVPGESAAFAVVSPRVYLPMADLAKTELLAHGGLARYRAFFKLPASTNADELVKAAQPRLDHFRLTAETVQTRKRDLGQSMDNLYHFLNLTGLVALLLGGIGVASAMNGHVKLKLGTVAILRCLGGSVAQTFAIYLAQGIALGGFGAVAGMLLGLMVQSIVPRAAADFIPFAFDFHTAWLAIFEAGGIGFVLCLLFALLPLLEVRLASPLAALRQAYETTTRRRDPMQWVVLGLLALGIGGFATTQGHNWKVGLGFFAGIAVALAVLAGVARGLMFAVRRWVGPALPFSFRQGLANLHRPNNRTLLLLLSLGLGVFLIVSTQLTQHILATELIVSTGTNQPNAVLFDIQPKDVPAVENSVRALHLPVLDELPIVTMRLSSIKGRTVESILADKKSHAPGWTLHREYRSTYTDHLRDAEKIIAGQWIARVTNADAPVPISVESGIAKELQVGLGDKIVFDVQGIPITTRVASLREVNWKRMQPNFFMLFPLGVLESAPNMHVLVTRVENSAQSADLQRGIVTHFPGVSVIDLTLILQTLDSILSKVSFVIRFMALFTVLTGVVVLTSTLLSGQFQRARESVLLRTLGASRGQVYRILAVEYASLGFLAALTGCLLAVGANWAMAAWVFDIHFAVLFLPLVIALLAAPLLTTMLGLFLSRRILTRPPLMILREEAG